jgi:hypothetical protein
MFYPVLIAGFGYYMDRFQQKVSSWTGKRKKRGDEE